ncbi:hypothetical protein DES53_103328 [Roseimicrobium gellanilyticum]|uniref:Oligosaccharide repeat unit polymerase n=2 Tax=Roseimicrobium gellanilyticum TaxID=748857 RepID=A0A366HP91_9BACT|nr:hypothetical protein DES53_103328 [Roseimicrobium gellanilyticum]
MDGRQPDQSDPGFYPMLGVIGTFTGTIMAMATVPSNPQKEGVLFIPGVLMALGLAIGPFLAFLRNPRNALRTENIIGMAAIYWLFMDLVTAVYDLPTVNRDAVRMSFASSGCFVIMFWLATMRKPWRLPKAFMASCSLRPEVSIILPITSICFVLSMLAYAIPCNFDVNLMLKSLLGNRFAAPWNREALGGWNAFVDHLIYFGYLLPTLATMLVRRKGLMHPASVVGILFAAIFLIFLMHSGSRRIIGVCLGSAVTYWVLDREHVRIWQLSASAFAVAFVLWLMQTMLVFRTVGVGEIGASNAAYIAWKSMSGDSVAGGAPKGLAVDDNFYRLAQIHSIVPEHHPYVYGKYIFYVLVRPIPRVFWENKPIDGGFQLQEFDAKGASLSVSIVGEAWLSWGPYAILITGWVFGRMARMNSPLFDASSGTIGPMFYGYTTMMLFVGWRSLQEILLFSYALLGWIFATWLYAKIRGRGFDQA